MQKLDIWFWQRMVTPHMAYLATALARRGHEVTYVAENELAPDRIALGWDLPNLGGASLRFSSSAKEARLLAKEAPEQAIHITQGLRSNGTIRFAQAVIKARGLRHFVVMETVNEKKWRYPKWLLYFILLARWARALDGILAIGAETPAWLRRLGPKELKVFPFAYFLSEPSDLGAAVGGLRFRFIFVGSLIPLKRVDFFLKSLALLKGFDFEVQVIGDGPQRPVLESLAQQLLPDRVSFLGVRPSLEIPRYMEKADCLVLPSSHDGWGAVISEALMVGTTVICSEECGARGVVEASKKGGVFRNSDEAEFRKLLETALVCGKVGKDQRSTLRSWARCLGAEAGASYLEALLSAGANSMSCIKPPWLRA